MPLVSPQKLLKGAFRKACRIGRNLRFTLLSTNNPLGGLPTKYQPVLYMGTGTISFEDNVKIGVPSSPGFWSTYCYIESRSRSASVSIGQNTWINNGFSVIAEKTSIKIGRDCLIGHNVNIFDSNFHDLDPLKRHNGGSAEVGNVEISDNVFIGSGATILKNSKIGTGCVIGASSVVTGEFPPNCIIAGNPAVIIRHL